MHQNYSFQNLEFLTVFAVWREALISPIAVYGGINDIGYSRLDLFYLLKERSSSVLIALTG